MPEIRKPFTLHKDHAIVHTASIDVKVLRIDKRQMTMGVFRQLEEAPLFMGKMEQDGYGQPVIRSTVFRGIPWGRVRYKWSESPDWADQYIVWQHKDKLYRCPIVSLTWLEDTAPYQDEGIQVLKRLGVSGDCVLCRDPKGTPWLISDIPRFVGCDGHAMFKSVFTAYTDLLEHITDQIETLNGLDQLFIAV